MIDLSVWIEIQGEWKLVGIIRGESAQTASFIYDNQYIEEGGLSISIHLPIEKKQFDAYDTKVFFDALLPEGFSRKSVAKWLCSDENDYLSILAGIGNECIGAVKICDNNKDNLTTDYLKLNQEKIKALAQEGATKSTELLVESHLSLAGASGKIGLYYDKKSNEWYQPIGDAPSTHIVKQSHFRYKYLVANELICLTTAKKLAINVVDHFIIDTNRGEDESVLFATQRYDRIKMRDIKIHGLNIPFRMHQEDFCQALGISSIEKYEKRNSHYMRQMFECIRRYSANPIEDQIELWDRIVFNYIIGNTDAHLKNYSLQYSEDLSTIRLAPAYDIVSTIIYGMPPVMSMSLGGIHDRREVELDTFRIAAKEIGIGEKMAMSRVLGMQEKIKDKLIETIDEYSAANIRGIQEIGEKILKNIKKY